MDDVKVREELRALKSLLSDGLRRTHDLLAELDEEGVALGRQGVWTRGHIAELRPHVAGRPGLSAMFDTLAAHPDSTFDYSAVLASSGLSDQEMRSELRFLSRITGKLFGAKRWPFEAEQGPIAPSGRAEMLYKMDSRIAHWWLDGREPAVAA